MKDKQHVSEIKLEMHGHGKAVAVLCAILYILYFNDTLTRLEYVIRLAHVSM